MFLFAALLANTLTAQNGLGLERNTEYHFQRCTAWHKGVPVTHISDFHFSVDSTMRISYWENGETKCTMGRAYFLKRYPSENGYETYCYQTNEVRVEFIQDGTRTILAIVYGNKRLVFHQEDMVTASNTKRNK